MKNILSKRKWEILLSIVAASIVIVFTSRAFASDAEDAISPDRLSNEQSVQVITINDEGSTPVNDSISYIVMEKLGDSWEFVKVKYKVLMETYHELENTRLQDDSVTPEEQKVSSEGNLEEPISQQTGK